MPRYYDERHGDRPRRGSRSHEDDESGHRRRGQMMRSERARRAPHDEEGHTEDMGQGGWFGDSEGHSEAARRGWERSDHRPSGWFGDAEGHSHASRRGWDNPGHGDSGWFGDPEGHSEASRRGWERSDHRPSGWFGDPEGHSQAARRGWGDSNYSRSGRDENSEQRPKRPRSRSRSDKE